MKVLKIAGISVLALLVLLMVIVQIRGNKKFDAPYPDIQASNDPDIIKRGEYLVFGPAHCGTCHVPMNKVMDVENGLKTALVGGWELDIPPAVLRASNLTPDLETGIGKLTDQEIARVLRYGVGHDGRYILPIMPYSEMSDADLQAIISYLRAQPPVHNPIEPSSFKFPGKALLAFGVLKPKISETPPPRMVSSEDPLIYGEYLAKGVANCMGCHTSMNLMNGEFTSPPFSGGFLFEPDEFTQGYAFVSPNLTPCEKTGIMVHHSEETFIQRFKSGRTLETSPMAWGAFSRMDSSELKAIYQYLVSLEPVENQVAKLVYLPGEKYK